jgi:hypothetical protein
MRLRLAALGLFILQITWSAAATGAPTLGPVHGISTGDPYCQVDPVLAPLRSGGFVVAWTHYDEQRALLRLADAEGRLREAPVAFPGRRLALMGSDAAGHLTVVWEVLHRLGYRLQRLSAEGQPLGPEVDLPIPGSAWRVDGAVASDGSVALLWANGERLIARWFSAQGVALSPEIPVDEYPGISYGLSSAVAIDTDGRLVVAWSRVDQYGTPAARRKAFFRRYATGGNAVGPAVEIGTDVLPAGMDWAPSPASLRDGGLAVAWPRTTLTGSDVEIWLQRFDAADRPAGAPVRITAAGTGYAPRLTSDGGDRLALVWEGHGRGQLQILPASGAPEPAIPVHPEALQGDVPETPAAVFLTTGRLAVVWRSYYIPNILPSGCESLGLFGRVVNPAPAVEPPQPAGREIPLSQGSDAGFAPQVALAPDGGWVALWQRGANGPVVSRAFDAAGQARGPEIPLNPARPAQASYDLSLAPFPGGGFVAAWKDLASPEPAAVRRLGADGQPAGPAVPVQLSQGARKIRVAAGGGGYLLAWLDGSSGVIRAQPFQTGDAPDGSPFFLADAAGSVPDFDFEAHPGGGFILAWAGSDTEIFARRLDAAGAPAGPDLLASTGDLVQALPRVTPDAEDGFAVAWAAVVPPFRFASAVFLRRFDAGGNPREGVIEVQALHDAYDGQDRSLYPRDLSFSQKGLLWVLLNRDGDFKEGLSGVAVAGGVPLGPPVVLDEGLDVGSASIAADGCGWLVSWSARRGTSYRSQARRFTGGCQLEPETLALNGGRFRAEIAWRTSDGKSGAGRAQSLTDDTGAFWFFAPENLELMLKVLDGREVNGAFWVFYATLTDVAFDLLVTDTHTGERKVYSKPLGRLESRADIRAFPVDPAPPAAAPPPPARWLADALSAEPPGLAAKAEAACEASESALCLAGGRFRVGVRFVDPRDGIERQAVARPLTSDSGSFWFFAPDNLELMLKIVDGRPLNDRFWFFAAGLSDVAYEITVTDTQTGSERVYVNPRGKLASRADTSAF